MRTHHAQSPARSGNDTDYSPRLHREMAAVAAYYRAECRGFREGRELDDWLEAKAEAKQLLDPHPGDEPKRNTKTAFLQKLEAELGDWDAKLAKLKAKAHAAKAAMRDEFELQLESLAAKRALAQEKLQELREHGEWAWEDLKDSADQIWSDLREALERSASRFK